MHYHVRVWSRAGALLSDCSDELDDEFTPEVIAFQAQFQHGMCEVGRVDVLRGAEFTTMQFVA